MGNLQLYLCTYTQQYPPATQLGVYSTCTVSLNIKNVIIIEELDKIDHEDQILHEKLRKISNHKFKKLATYYQSNSYRYKRSHCPTYNLLLFISLHARMPSSTLSIYFPGFNHVLLIPFSLMEINILSVKIRLNDACVKVVQREVCFTDIFIA